jgi:UDP-N-acetyl-D-glucosamine dehydrogenase
MAKLIENTFRHVNIALVGELPMLAPTSAWTSARRWTRRHEEVRLPPFWPGPGGRALHRHRPHLSWRVSQRLGFGVRFVEHAMEVNNRMPAYVASRVAEALNGRPARP